MTYGLLRYLNTDVELDGSDPPIGFNYLGRLGAAAAEISDEVWRISSEGLSLTGAASAIPMPLPHTVELNAGTVDTDAALPARQLDLARSAFDETEVSRLSQLWFEALHGMCAHVRSGGGG
ncbi:linear gramicidin synthetase subunit C domain protein [Mycobacterium xenopi 4042]|uniref:Linear gramicidin synthetase subunit C domain protein n=1 Tax=Mycobacterium xenopi 4042 TaxID=1299334 RepID=X8E862_MYCXE|nr:linear gramicidin synthetase subunit C domain protein [Mycobacterium xenopi 4042]